MKVLSTLTAGAILAVLTIGCTQQQQQIIDEFIPDSPTEPTDDETPDTQPSDVVEYRIPTQAPPAADTQPTGTEATVPPVQEQPDADTQPAGPPEEDNTYADGVRGGVHDGPPPAATPEGNTYADGIRGGG